MKYFVDRIGRIITAEAPKGWFTKEVNQNMFTNKKDAISAAKKQIKAEIHLLKGRLKALKAQGRRFQIKP